MKILWFSDAHLRGTTPRSRIDDYPKALEAKFDEITEIIQRENIDLVLNGGDLFHAPAPSNSVITTFTKKMKMWECPIYSIVGSHDKYGYNDDTLHRTVNGILDAAGVTQLVKDPILLADDVWVCGTSHSYTLDDDPKNYCVKKPESCEYLIQLVHGLLVAKPFFGKYTLLQDVKTDADLVLVAHFHPGFEPTTIGDTTFVNAGSLGRVENIQRLYPPSVIIIDTKDKSWRIVNLQSAKEDVFWEKTATVENFTADIETFIESLKSKIGSLETYDVKDLIIKVGELEGVPPPIIDRALKYIENASECDD